MPLDRFLGYLRKKTPLGYKVSGVARNLSMDPTPLLGSSQADQQEIKIYQEAPETTAERYALNEKSKAAGDQFINAFSYLSGKKRDQFTALQSSLKQAINLTRLLIVDNNDYLASADVISNQTQSAKMLAVDLSRFKILEALKRMRGLADSPQMTDAASKTLDLSEITWAGNFVVPTNGVNLYDLVRRPLPEISTSILILTLVRFIEENPRDSQKTPSVFDAYPNLKKFELARRNSAFRNLLYFSELEAFNVPFACPPELRQTKDRVFAGIKKIQDRLFQALTDPSNQFHNDVALAFLKLFDGKALNPYYAIQLLGLFDEAKVRKIYDLFTHQARNHYYAMLFSVIAERVGGILGLETIENIEPVLNGNGLLEDSTSEPDLFAQSAKHSAAISSNTSQSEFNLDPQQIEFSHIAPPTEIKVNLDHQNPQKVSVKFVWANELGESAQVKFNIDSKRQRFGWSILDNPDGVEALSFKKAFLAAATKILETISIQTAQQRRERLEQRSQTSGATSQTTKRTERNEDPVYALRRQTRQDTNAQNQKSALERLQELQEEEEKAAIKKEIVFPQEAQWQEMVRGLNEPDKQLLKREILDFNADGTKRLDRKVARGKNGRPLYTRRISCSVPKGLRILMTEVEAVNGVRRFEILSARYRKDVYRRAGI